MARRREPNGSDAHKPRNRTTTDGLNPHWRILRSGRRSAWTRSTRTGREVGYTRTSSPRATPWTPRTHLQITGRDGGACRRHQGAGEPSRKASYVQAIGARGRSTDWGQEMRRPWQHRQLPRSMMRLVERLRTSHSKPSIDLGEELEQSDAGLPTGGPWLRPFHRLTPSPSAPASSSGPRFRSAPGIDGDRDSRFANRRIRGAANGRARLGS